MNEFLPIKVDYPIASADWTVLTAIPTKWHYNGVYMSLETTIPGRLNRVGKPSSLSIHSDHISLSSKSELQSERIALLKSSLEVPLKAAERAPITIFECLPTKGRSRPRNHDPHKLRDDFLGIKENVTALLEFLNNYGAWGNSFLFGRWSTRPLFSGSAPESVKPTIVPAHYFWHYRALLRNRLEQATHDPTSWFANALDFPSFHRIPKYPFLSCHVACALEAIEVSFAFDFLKEAPTSLCARDDCRKLFFINRKGKKFCSEKCARCVVTRRGRAKMTSVQSKG